MYVPFPAGAIATRGAFVCPVSQQAGCCWESQTWCAPAMHSSALHPKRTALCGLRRRNLNGCVLVVRRGGHPRRTWRAVLDVQARRKVHAAVGGDLQRRLLPHSRHHVDVLDDRLVGGARGRPGGEGRAGVGGLPQVRARLARARGIARGRRAVLLVDLPQLHVQEPATQGDGRGGGGGAAAARQASAPPARTATSSCEHLTRRWVVQGGGHACCCVRPSSCLARGAAMTAWACLPPLHVRPGAGRRSTPGACSSVTWTRRAPGSWCWPALPRR